LEELPGKNTSPKKNKQTNLKNEPQTPTYIAPNLPWRSMPKLQNCRSAMRERAVGAVLKIRKEAGEEEEGGGCLEGEGVFVAATAAACLRCKAASLLLFVSEAPSSPPGVEVAMLLFVSEVPPGVEVAMPLFVSEAPSPPGVEVAIAPSQIHGILNP
jgi:hypothetical protein